MSKTSRKQKNGPAPATTTTVCHIALLCKHVLEDHSSKKSFNKLTGKEYLLTLPLYTFRTDWCGWMKHFDAYYTIGRIDTLMYIEASMHLMGILYTYSAKTLTHGPACLFRLCGESVKLDFTVLSDDHPGFLTATYEDLDLGICDMRLKALVGRFNHMMATSTNVIPFGCDRDARIVDDSALFANFVLWHTPLSLLDISACQGYSESVRIMVEDFYAMLGQPVQAVLDPKVVVDPKAGIKSHARRPFSSRHTVAHPPARHVETVCKACAKTVVLPEPPRWDECFFFEVPTDPTSDVGGCLKRDPVQAPAKAPFNPVQDPASKAPFNDPVQDPASKARVRAPTKPPAKSMVKAPKSTVKIPGRRIWQDKKFKK
jgi:hypothetical protein